MRLHAKSLWSTMCTLVQTMFDLFNDQPHLLLPYLTSTGFTMACMKL